MENLQIEPAKTDGIDKTEEFVLEEKVHSGMIVYDIYRKGHYLMTLGNDGAILNMNFDAPEVGRELFRLPQLNQFIEKIAHCFTKKMMLA